MTTSMLDRARVEIKLGEYGVAPATAVADPLLLGTAQDYRRAAAARLYPLDGSAILEKIPTAEFHVSRKVDGEFTVLCFRVGEACTINPGGTVRVGLPVLDEAARLLSKAGVKEALLACELYLACDDRRSRVHDIVSAATRPDSTDQLDRIRLAVFDVISLNGSPPPAAFQETWQQLTRLLESGIRIHPVEAQWVSRPSAIRELYQKWVQDEGAEGLVCRSDAAGTFKIKPRHNLDVAVIGFAESTGDRAGLLHDLLVAVLRREGTFHVLGRVGGGFTDDQRKEMLSDLKDMAADSEYSEVSSDHVAYQMVRPNWVVEISCLDLVAQNTRGGPVGRMVLDWHENNGHSIYRTLRRLPLASVISPQFVRRREDKQVEPTDVRIAQIGDLVELPQVEKDSRQLVLPGSELLRREVYVKELKGESMVRKLVLWKTNKDQSADDFPAYVVHLTDFSPNRKDPLAREIRVSSSREQIEQLFEQLKTENIVKGWSAYAGAVAATPVTPPREAVEADTAARKPIRKHVASEGEAPPPVKSRGRKKSG